MKRTRAILLGIFIASLALPPAAWAVTSTQGTDGVSGNSGAAQKDAETINASHPSGQTFCSQEARGAVVNLPGGSIITLNNCSTNTITATDICSNTANGIPCLDSATKLSTAIIPDLVPIYRLPGSLTGTGSITATATDGTSTNTGTRTVTATATGTGTSVDTGTVTGTQTVSGTASATASGTAAWTGTVTGIGTGVSTVTETNVSVGNASEAPGMLSIGSSGQAQVDNNGNISAPIVQAGLGGSNVSPLVLTNSVLGFNYSSSGKYAYGYGYAGAIVFSSSSGRMLFYNAPQGSYGTSASAIPRMVLCPPSSGEMDIGNTTCGSYLLRVGAAGLAGFDASANVFAPNISATPAVSSIPSTTGGSTTLDPGWLPAATAAAYGAIKLFTGTPSVNTYAGAVGSSLLASPGDHAHPAGYSKGVYVNSGAATVDTTAAATPTGAGQILQTTAAGTAVFAAAPTASGQVAKATATNAWGWAGLAAVDVGLGNVTNDAQTKAAILPNTAPSAGQIPVGNAGGTAYAPTTVSGDATLASTGAVTVKGINGTTMSALSTGLVKNTTGTGVPSIAVAADLPGGPYVPTSTTHLSGDVATSRNVSTTNGLQGGGDLSADRTLSPVYGTTANTVMQGNDSRVVNALQSLPLPYATATGNITITGTGTATASTTTVSTGTLTITATVTGTATGAGTGTLTGTGTITATGYATLTKTATGTATVTVTGTGSSTSTTIEVNASIGNVSAAPALLSIGTAGQAQFDPNGNLVSSGTINMTGTGGAVASFGSGGNSITLGSLGNASVFGANLALVGNIYTYGKGSSGQYSSAWSFNAADGSWNLFTSKAAGADGAAFDPYNNLTISSNGNLSVNGGPVLSNIGHATADLLLPASGVCSAGQVLTYLATGAPTCVTNGSGTGIGCSGSCSAPSWAMFTDSTHITNVAAPTYSSVGAPPTSRTIATTNGLQGGGDLSADRSLSPVYGTTVNTVAQGNDSRITGAVQSSSCGTSNALLKQSGSCSAVSDDGTTMLISHGVNPALVGEMSDASGWTGMAVGGSGVASTNYMIAENPTAGTSVNAPTGKTVLLNVGNTTYASVTSAGIAASNITATPTANAVVKADTFGTLNPWVGGRTVDSWQDKNSGNISTSGSAWLQVTSTHSFSVPIYGGGTGYYGGTIMCTGSVTALPNSVGGLNLAIDLDGAIVATAAQTTTTVVSYLNLSAVAYNSFAASGSHTVNMWIQSSNGSTVFSVNSSVDPFQSASLNCQLISH